MMGGRRGRREEEEEEGGAEWERSIEGYSRVGNLGGFFWMSLLSVNFSIVD